MFFEFLPVGAAESAATLFLDQVSCGQLYEVSQWALSSRPSFVCLFVCFLCSLVGWPPRRTKVDLTLLCSGAQLVITNLTGLYR